MSLLQELQMQGFRFALLDNDRVAVVPMEKLTPELKERLKASKPEIIRLLKENNFDDHPVEVRRPKDSTSHEEAKRQTKPLAQGNIVNSEPSREAKKWCEGYRPPRFVHPAVCHLHLEQGDIRCINCRYLNAEGKQAWLNGYLNKAIVELNRFYRKGDRIESNPESRKRIEVIEEAITNAFLALDLEDFRKAVDEWERIFKDMRINKSK